MITSTVRDLLHYVKDKLKKKGYEVIYIDTDGVMINDKGKNITDLLNKLVQKWSKERFGKKSSIEFDYEGNFEKLLIVALTHYKGYLKLPNGGLKEEIKGIEVKRKDSSTFMAKFQNELIEKILNKESENKCVKWIEEQIHKIKTGKIPLENIAFPCKLANKPEDYKNVPIFVRALKYTQESLSKFKKRIGESFYYIYVKPFGNEIKEVKEYYVDGKKLTPKPMIELGHKYFPKVDLKGVKVLKKADKEVLLKKIKEDGKLETKIRETKGKIKNVLAFSDKEKKHIKNVDWKRMIDRNITNKVKTIFEAMGWTFTGRS